MISLAFNPLTPGLSVSLYLNYPPFYLFNDHSYTSFCSELALLHIYLFSMTYPTPTPYPMPVTYPTPPYAGPTLCWTCLTPVTYPMLTTYPTLTTYLTSKTYSTLSSLSICKLSLAATPSTPLLNPQVHERFLLRTVPHTPCLCNFAPCTDLVPI